MALEILNNKKFLDSVGVGHLWDKIKDRYDSKLDNVAAKDDSVVISEKKDIRVQISAEEGNLLELKTTGNKGLYVKAPDAADTYAITKDADGGEYAAVYRLKKYVKGTGEGVDAGVTINIPKDMVVQTGTVETKTTTGAWGNAGTYIHLVLANAENSDLWIPADSLIEYVTSGSQATDMVVITIDPTTHEVTAAITDDSITAAKLVPAIREQLSKANTAVQTIEEGSANGTISVDGTDVAVHGLGSAAYTNSNAYDAAGAAAAVLGSDTDAATADTVHGAKKYASDAYAAIVALSNAEIDAALASA